MAYTEEEQRKIDEILGTVTDLTFDLDVSFPQLRQQNLPEVREILRQALDQFPESPDLHLQYSLTLLRQGHAFEARIHYDAAMKEHGPSSAAFEFNRCRLVRVTAPHQGVLARQIAQTFRNDDLSNEQKIRLNEMNSELKYGPRY